MVGSVKLLSVVVMVLVPGALAVAIAWVLARIVVHQLRLQADAPHGRKWARAVAAVRWRDVVREARALTR